MDMGIVRHTLARLAADAECLKDQAALSGPRPPHGSAAGAFSPD
jgi:hypothetical protein